MSAFASGEDPNPNPNPNLDPNQKSIITLYITCHGTDIPYEEFSDPSVRILSQAGKFGCWGFFNKIPTRQISNWIKELKEENTQASTYSILEKIKILLKNKTTGEDAQGLINSLKNSKFSENNEKTINYRQHNQTKKIMDANENWQIYTPVFNHLYNFDDATQRDQGIFIMDIKNKPELTNFKVNDDLLQIMNEKKREIFRKNYPQYYAPSIRITELKQSDLIKFLKDAGFDIINIIDKSCREYEAIIPKEEFEKINAKEIEASESIDKSLGGKKRRKSTRKRRKRRNFKRKTRMTK